MKAFLAAVVAVVVISGGTAFVLNGLGWSSANVYKSENVRN